MFERFTATARRVIVSSQSEAQVLRQDHVGPHHLLLGVLTAEAATAGAVLASLGIEAEEVQRRAVAKYGSGDEEPSGHIEFSDDAKKALENSLRESLTLGHTYIGTEHIVLGLISDPSTCETFAGLGVRAEDLRETIMRRLGSAAGAEPAEP
jgi:ATP-dependent Clp protease ATP-binding subunit ClpA